MKLYIISDTRKENLIKEMRQCGVSPAGIKLMADKGEIKALKIAQFDNRGLNILKQEALSVGAETAVSQKVGNFVLGKSDGILLATENQINQLISKLAHQPFQLKQLAEELKRQFRTNTQVYKIRNKKFYFSRKQYVMGILNITPDSFFDGSLYTSETALEKKINQILTEKADIIDIGAESTRPGADKVSAKEEIKRLQPALKLVRSLTDIPVSVDTYKSEVARFALEHGADIINDISGMQFDKKMPQVISEYSATAVLMHIQGTPRNMQNNPSYKNLIQEIIDYLQLSAESAYKNGIQQIIIDPGIGFGKTVYQNYEILDKLRDFSILHCPILIGLSRKSLIGKILKQNPEERLSGTIALNLTAILNGASLIRVHDVKEGRNTIKLAEAFLKTRGRI